MAYVGKNLRRRAVNSGATGDHKNGEGQGACAERCLHATLAAVLLPSHSCQLVAQEWRSPLVLLLEERQVN